MTAKLIRNRSQLVKNAKSYKSLVQTEVYSLASNLKKTALETITRTQAWIAVRDTDNDGQDTWLPAPMKWVGPRDVEINTYESERVGGIDLQKVEQTLARLDYDEAARSHPAWRVLREYASDLGLELRSGTKLWVIKGEDLPYAERNVMDILVELADSRKLSAEAREVVSKRLVA